MSKFEHFEDLSPKTYRIEYLDPETQEQRAETRTFEASANITAREVAEDVAYALADKGAYQLIEVTE